MVEGGRREVSFAENESSEMGDGELVEGGRREVERKIGI